MKWRRQYEGPYLVTRILSPLTVEIQRSAKSRPKKVHIDKLKDFVGSPPLDWRSPSSGTTADENEVSDTRFATVGASSVSVAWPASTAKDAGERWKELQGNVGAQSEGIPVEAVEKPAEKKPPSYTVCCSDDFSSPSSNPLSYDCSGEGRREEVWVSTGVVEGRSPVSRNEVLVDAFSNTVQLRMFRRRPAPGNVGRLVSLRVERSSVKVSARNEVLNPCAAEFIPRRSPENFKL